MMEQDPDFITTTVGWVVEQIVTLAIGSVLGAIGARWFFGKKNLEKLERLQREFDQLRRERDAPSPAESRDDVSEPPSPPKPEPAPDDSDLKVRSLLPLPGTTPPDALLSLQELLDRVKGQTGMKADRLLKPHKGRRYRVRGRVETVDDYMVDGVHMKLETADGVTVILWFDKSRRLVELLETLARLPQLSHDFDDVSSFDSRNSLISLSPIFVTPL